MLIQTSTAITCVELAAELEERKQPHIDLGHDRLVAQFDKAILALRKLANTLTTGKNWK